ncbi:MAG TPA: energy transducer TonB [Candidatus Sulfopaludibacter sp.]|jgi:protein TonB|nr:energy transducer TonB [Candidatus Sulfopaludibacter sp.]
MARIQSHAFAVFLALLPVGLMWGQSPPKKLTHAEALSGVTAKANPQYPPIAQQLKIEGSVELEAVVSETGSVEDVVITSGNPILTKPAAEALKKWKFSPFQQDGKPVKALAPVTIVFKR